MDNFRTLTEAAKPAGAEEWLPGLVATGLVKPSTLIAHGSSADIWQDLTLRLGQALPPAGRGCSARRDHPTAQPSSGGPLDKAFAAASYNERELSLHLCPVKFGRTG